LNNRVVQLDALALPDHYYLDESDVCFFAGEYTAGAGHAYSATNQLILNFKKGVDTRGTAQWPHKERAIAQAASIFRGAIKSDVDVTFVPVPPSKSKQDPLYDDRMIRLLRTMCVGRPWTMRDMIIQEKSVEPAHKAVTRPTPSEVAENYRLDESMVEPTPQLLCIVDDVLTTGCHFKAVKGILTSRFPTTPVIGLFLARRVPKSVDASDFDSD
jgi:hypothetical protein